LSITLPSQSRCLAESPIESCVKLLFVKLQQRAGELPQQRVAALILRRVSPFDARFRALRLGKRFDQRLDLGKRVAMSHKPKAKLPPCDGSGRRLGRERLRLPILIDCGPACRGVVYDTHRSLTQSIERRYGRL
jgi:hypothetical protein